MTYGLRELDGRLAELCDECGFDGRDEYDPAERLAAGYAALAVLAGHEDAHRRPAAETWSGAEYAEHVVSITAGILGGCHRALGLPAPGPMDDLAAAAAAARTLAERLDGAQGSVAVDMWPFPATVDAALMHLLHDLEHHVLDVRRGLAVLGLERGTEIVTTRR
ncbi:MAG: hypothetical protein GC157_18295 [Frankiales bacterium]|nr:hypothetical protein [Frankiales bacterium]